MIPAYDRVITNEFPEKKKDKTALIIVAVVVLVLIVPIAIAATTYVYVTGMISPPPSDAGNAGVTCAKTSGDLLKVRQNYNNGYSNFAIYVDGSFVEGLENIGYWNIGEQIMIGSSNTGGYKVSGNPLSTGEYDVTVSIMDSIVFDGVVKIY